MYIFKVNRSNYHRVGSSAQNEKVIMYSGKQKNKVRK